MLTHLLQQPHYYLDGSKFKQVILKCFFLFPPWYQVQSGLFCFIHASAHHAPVIYNTFYNKCLWKKNNFFVFLSCRKKLWWNRWPTRLWSCSSSWRWPHTLSRTHEAASDSSSTKPRWASASGGWRINTAVTSWGSNNTLSLQSKPVIWDQWCWTA